MRGDAWYLAMTTTPDAGLRMTHLCARRTAHAQALQSAEEGNTIGPMLENCKYHIRQSYLLLLTRMQ